jgi:hypothetical protein
VQPAIALSELTISVRRERLSRPPQTSVPVVIGLTIIQQKSSCAMQISRCVFRPLGIIFSLNREPSSLRRPMSVLRLSGRCRGCRQLFLAQHEKAQAIYFCLECQSKTLVDVGAAGNMAPVTQFFCFACAGGYSWDEGILEECPLCQEVEYRKYMSLMGCRECFGAYVAQEHT